MTSANSLVAVLKPSDLLIKTDVRRPAYKQMDGVIGVSIGRPSVTIRESEELLVRVPSVEGGGSR